MLYLPCTPVNRAVYVIRTTTYLVALAVLRLGIDLLLSISSGFDTVTVQNEKNIGKCPILNLMSVRWILSNFQLPVYCESKRSKYYCQATDKKPNVGKKRNVTHSHSALTLEWQLLSSCKRASPIIQVNV